MALLLRKLRCLGIHVETLCTTIAIVSTCYGGGRYKKRGYASIVSPSTAAARTATAVRSRKEAKCFPLTPHVIPVLSRDPLFFTGFVDRQPCVYLLAQASHSPLYTGVTSSLLGRIHQHREEVAGIKRLVWFEAHERMEQAILRKKRIKRWPRAWKYDLIHRENPTWRDLAEDFCLPPLPQREAGPGLNPG